MGRKFHIILSSEFLEIELVLARVLKERYNLHDISLRQSLKSILNKADEPLAKEIGDYLKRGELLPTDVITRLINNEIACVSGNILLRDYPRTFNQYNALQELLQNTDFSDTICWLLKLNTPNSGRRQNEINKITDSVETVRIIEFDDLLSVNEEVIRRKVFEF